MGLVMTLLLLGLLRGMGNAISMANGQLQDNVTTDLIARSQSLLRRDVPLLRIKAAGHLDAILDPIFASYHRRIPDFAAWAFQWRTSYSFLRAGIITAITLPFLDPPRLQHFGEAWDDLITEKFDEIVLQPEGGEATLRGARNRWEIDVDTEFKNTITDTILVSALIRGHDLAPWAWQPIAVENLAAKDADSLVDAIGAVSNPIKVHAIRPLLSRLILRPPVAAAVTVTGEAISNYGNFGFLGNIAGFTATIAGFMSVDYLISRIDAAVSQQDLEIALHHALDTEHDRLRHDWLVAMRLRIDGEVAAARNLLKKP